jgi:hypothetical protein
MLFGALVQRVRFLPLSDAKPVAHVVLMLVGGGMAAASGMLFRRAMPGFATGRSAESVQQVDTTA